MLDRTTNPDHWNAVWSDDMTADLRKAFADGLSGTDMATEINAKYGTAFTRNAVIGRLHRIGLKRGRPVRQVRAKRERKPRGPYKRAPWAVPTVTAAPRQANTEPASAFVPDPRFACTILDLTNETCRFVTSEDSPFVFCGTPGADLAGGMPYCGNCARIVYRGKREAA